MFLTATSLYTEYPIHPTTVVVGGSQNKKFSYRRGIARCVVSIEIVPIATQQCRNYLYNKS